MDKEAETQYCFYTSLIKAVHRNIKDYSITVLNSMFCLNCDCFLIISLYRGRFCLGSPRFSSLYHERGYIVWRIVISVFHCTSSFMLPRSYRILRDLIGSYTGSYIGSLTRSCARILSGYYIHVGFLPGQ